MNSPASLAELDTPTLLLERGNDVDRHDDWVIFTPEGYFDASAAEGQFLFGWQLNRGRDQTPQFEPASHLQKVYERPGIINRILAAGNVADALAANERPRPAVDGTVDFRNELRNNILRAIQKLTDLI